MRYGIHGANVGRLASPEGVEVVSAAIRRHRLESVWAWEQIAVPAKCASPWPYSPDGRLATPDDVALMDPLVWLASVGALAPEVNLATGIFLLALHDPITAAKAVATLDLLTRERIILGVGVGWLKEEYDALARDFPGRGKRTDDSIAALRRLWSDSPSIAGTPSAGHARQARTLGAQRFLIDVYGTEPDTVGRFIEKSLNDLG